nr:ABC transporter ATP-binding protein [Candidatus Freyarchaeota archaeon]
MKGKKTDSVIVQRLTKKYGEVEVLRGVDLRIKEGEFYALMGPNGSGKTTLTSIIASVRTPTSGKVEIFGKTPEEAKELMAYIPQESFSSTVLSGRENLMYFAGLLGYPKNEAKKLVDGLLDKFGLSEDADKRVSKYSGGMRKRLEVATALFPSIRLSILDEPTTGLDPSARREFLGVLSDLSGEGITILLTTHIGSDAEVASRVGLMDKGKIIAEDEPEKLKKSSGLVNVINIETATKNKKVSDVLSGFSKGKKLLETDVGYRVYAENTEEETPNIVRKLDEIGCKVIRIETVKPTLEDVFFKLTQKSLQ